MITLTLFQVSTIITAFTSLFLGALVYFSGEKTKLNFSWLLASAVIGLWSLGLFGVVFVQDDTTAWFWQYILDIGGICVPILYFNFLLHLLKKEKTLIWLQILSLVCGTALIILNFTPFFKTGISPKFGIMHWIDPGQLYFLFPLYFSVFVLLAIFVVVKEYIKTTDKDRKRQLLYVLIAQIFGFGGGLTDFLPQLFNVYPFGNYFIVLYTIFISYAALKHHLFNMKIIATELLIFVIWTLLAARTLLSNSLNDLIMNTIMLAGVVVAGYLLIKSVLKEVKQKEQIYEMAKKLEKAYEVEKHANEELKKLDTIKNQFLIQTQHDLRTPLSIIRSYCDLILGGTLGKQNKKTLDVARRMQIVAEEKIRDVNNFLDTTQFQLGKKVVNLQSNVDVSIILDEIFKQLEPEAKEKKIYFKLEKPNTKLIIEADREKLKSAIYNVIDNCVKYTTNGRVDIALTSQGNKIKINIKDTGIGIPQDKIETLFNSAFNRGEEAKKASPSGKGIGLYLAGQIIKAHNGSISAHSEGKGRGSLFSIELPAAVTV